MAHILSTKCVAVGCGVKYRTHPSMKLFNFPLLKISNPDSVKRVAKWLEVSGVEKYRKGMRLCQRHFSDRQFYDGMYRCRLVRSSVPLYPSGPLNPITGDYAPLDNSSLISSNNLEEHSGGAGDHQDGNTSPALQMAENPPSTSHARMIENNDSNIAQSSAVHENAENDSASQDCHPNVDSDDYPSDVNASSESELEDEICLESIDSVNDVRLLSAVKSLQMLINALSVRIDSFTSVLLAGSGISGAKLLAKSICEELNNFEKRFL